MPGRTYNAGSAYRYGFNGKENDKDISEGDLDFGARIYDGRLGRWLSLDPLQQKFPNESPYCGIGDNPIGMVDPDGKKKYVYHLQYDANTGKYTVLKVETKKGLKLRIDRDYSPQNSSTYTDSHNWYNYETFIVTVVNGKKGVDYSNKTKKEDQIIGKPAGSTNILPDWESLVPDPLNNGGGIMFTKEGGMGHGTRKGDAEQIQNIEGLSAAIGGLGNLSPETIDILDVWLDSPDRASNALELKGIYDDIKSLNKEKSGKTQETKKEKVVFCKGGCDEKFRDSSGTALKTTLPATDSGENHNETMEKLKKN